MAAPQMMGLWWLCPSSRTCPSADAVKTAPLCPFFATYPPVRKWEL
jgi:hypothetical protein